MADASHGISYHHLVNVAQWHLSDDNYVAARAAIVNAHEAARRCLSVEIRRQRASRSNPASWVPSLWVNGLEKLWLPVPQTVPDGEQIVV